MAWKGKNNTGNANSNMFPFTFVNYTLTEEQTQMMDEIKRLKPPTIEHMIDELCEENYKVTIAIDFKNEAFVCRVTGNEGNVNFNLCMSSFGGDVYDCVLIAWWKVFEVFSRGKWDVEEKPKKMLRG